MPELGPSGSVRGALSNERPYRDTVWPVILGYAETSRLLVAWCELRQSFRHFRTERIIEAEMLDERNGLRQGELRRRWQLWREANVRSA